MLKKPPEAQPTSKTLAPGNKTLGRNTVSEG
jgi:hypothetical protein